MGLHLNPGNKGFQEILRSDYVDKTGLIALIVTVAVFSRDDHPCVRVEDDGIGIPAADRDRVFERFYRVDKSRSRQIGGTGLGLSIVKHGAMFHGAQVKMESEEGSGTKVEISFVNSRISKLKLTPASSDCSPYNSECDNGLCLFHVNFLKFYALTVFCHKKKSIFSHN